MFFLGLIWMEAEVWGVSVWTGELSEGSQIFEHRTVQAEELLWGISGSPGDHEEREQDSARFLHCFFAYFHKIKIMYIMYWW